MGFLNHKNYLFLDMNLNHQYKLYHHLLINVDEVNYSMPIPSSKQHLHFGLGQTETLLSLPPGRHKLQLILGDKYHVPHDPPLVSEIIEVKVIE